MQVERTIVCGGVTGPGKAGETPILKLNSWETVGPRNVWLEIEDLHEKLWRDPTAFIPTRFMPPAPPPDRFAYLPFGVGARVCIGAHFALVEATLALAKMIGAFKVELIDKAPVMPVGVVTTQPDRSPMFRIAPR